MSSFLYRLGRRAARSPWRVVTGWLLLLAVLGGLAAVSGGQLRDDLDIPGTESQEGLDVLETRFPEVAGTASQIVFRAPDGERVTSYQRQVGRLLAAVKKVDHVLVVTDPFEKGTRRLALSDDGRHALAQVQLDQPVEQLDDGVVEEIEDAATEERPSGGEPGRAGDLDVFLGGQVYQPTSTPVSYTEAIGLAVALLVLVLTLGSLVAAGIPLLTAVLGVTVTMAGLLALAALVTINTSTPTLALMIGLAVGIDYALFLAARHRDQLGDGMDVEESVARSVATAGSAVVFAGATVIIALCGLVVARIPFLSVMGAAAAIAVAVAVAVSLTLVPSVLALTGERLRPKERRRPSGGSFSRRWVALVTRRPAVTAFVTVAGLLALAVPGKDLSLGLPDAGYAEAGSTERLTYDLVAEVYGEGHNSPLLVIADIIRSRDPVGDIAAVGKDVAKLDGVETVALTTPNRSADLGIVQVVPEHGQTDPRTAELVREIRATAGDIEERHGVRDLMVTGQTAATIDVADRLAGALLPFGLVVVGLSLLLLTAVFRSVLVPLKATGGYLLSVGAAFGAVSLVFEHGWLADALNVERPGAVAAFLPIMLMGVLFGLAMDYEVFLVARMREHWAHSAETDDGAAREAIAEGFAGSARVVVAAAVIMVAVFASFVPHGDSSVKPMAVGLAVGVLVDAFVVRMTLVPAVMALLGERAWRLPASLDRLLPSFDVEGEGLAAHLEHEEWSRTHGPAVVRAEDVRLAAPDGAGPVLAALDLVVRPGHAVLVTGSPLARRAFLNVVAGRLGANAGRLVVLDHPLPAEAAAVRSLVAVDTALAHPAGDPLVLADVEDVTAADVELLADHLAAGTAVVLGCPPDVARRTAFLLTDHGHRAPVHVLDPHDKAVPDPATAPTEVPV